MQHSLRLTPFHDLLQIEVQAAYRCDDHRLEVAFQLSDTSAVDWSALDSEGLRDESERMDFLWESSCLEIFLQPVTNVHNFSDLDSQLNEANRSYVEINVSPAGKWNAYHFDNYRSPDVTPPRRLELDADDLSLRVTGTGNSRCISLNLDPVVNVIYPSLGASENISDITSWRANITCVLTQTDSAGRQEDFYALKHAQPADFHDAATWFELSVS